MWVRFWTGTSSDPERETSYEWLSDRNTDEALKEYAEEYMESIAWLRGAERIKYGFDRLTELPENIRLAKIKSYEDQIRSAQAMLDFLNGVPAPTVPETKSRFDRDLDFKI